MHYKSPPFARTPSGTNNMAKCVHIFTPGLHIWFSYCSQCKHTCSSASTHIIIGSITLPNVISRNDFKLGSQIRGLKTGEVVCEAWPHRRFWGPFSFTGSLRRRQGYDRTCSQYKKEGWSDTKYQHLLFLLALVCLFWACTRWSNRVRLMKASDHHMYWPAVRDGQRWQWDEFHYHVPS